MAWCSKKDSGDTYLMPRTYIDINIDEKQVDQFQTTTTGHTNVT